MMYSARLVGVATEAKDLPQIVALAGLTRSPQFVLGGAGGLPSAWIMLRIVS